MPKFHKCYLCHSKNIVFAFKKLSHEIWLCKNCGLCFLKFDYDYNKFIHDYYQKGYFTGNPKLRAYADYEGDKKIISKNMGNYLKRIQKYLDVCKKSENFSAANIFSARSYRRDPDRRRGCEHCKKMFANQNFPKLLDCGCAMGYFMEEAQKAGFNPYGIDISEYAAEKAKKLFPNHVFIGPIEKIDKIISSPNLPNLPNSFDVITMFDLIEHLKDPRLVLQKLGKILKKNGLLVIQTGDVSSHWAKMQGPNWHFFAPPQHLNFFSRKTLTDLLNQAGYKVVSIETDGKWVSLRYLFHMMRYANRDRTGDFLYKLTYKNILGRIPVFLKFNDNLILLAKKS